MTIRLHDLYPIANGSPIALRDPEVAALRADALAAPDEDLIFDICFVCSEATIASRVVGTGTTAARYSTTVGPLCDALLEQIGASPGPTLSFIRHAILGYRYIATSVQP